MDFDNKKFDVEVELTIFQEEEGGHPIDIFSGYKSGHMYLDDIDWIVCFSTNDYVDFLFPGETRHLFATFYYHPEALQGRIHVGKTFLLRESFKAIGHGIIINLLYFEKHVLESIQKADTMIDTSFKKPKNRKKKVPKGKKLKEN